MSAKLSPAALLGILMLSSGALARADYFVLRDGTTFAGPVSAEGRTIDVQTLDGLVSIEPSEVTMRESAATLRTMLRPLNATAHDRGGSAIAQLVLWCRDKGLFAEMLDLADDVLAVDPKEARTTSLVQDVGERQGLPALLLAAGDDAIGTLRAACDKGPARRLLARAWIARMPDDAEQATLIALLKDHRATVRGLAASMLRDSRPEKALEPLIGASLFDPNRDVRHEALDAVVAYQNPGAAAPYARLLANERESVRLAAIEALQALANPKAAGALISTMAPSSGGGTSRGYVSVGTQTTYVRDYDVEVAQGAVIAKPVIGVIQDGAVLDVKVIGSFASRSLAEREATHRALVSLTRRDYGFDYDRWQTWWLANRTQLSAATEPTTTPGS
jgi:hypothetical protein